MCNNDGIGEFSDGADGVPTCHCRICRLKASPNRVSQFFNTGNDEWTGHADDHGTTVYDSAVNSVPVRPSVELASSTAETLRGVLAKLRDGLGQCEHRQGKRDLTAVAARLEQSVIDLDAIAAAVSADMDSSD